MDDFNPKFNSMNVMVCDDDDMILKIMSHILREMGFRAITSVRDPKTALRLLSDPGEDDFDFVVCDWKMPEMTGIELLRQLRKRGNPVPFIMLTSNVTPEAVSEARDEKVDAYIAKPFTADQVQRKVGTVALRALRDD